MCQDHRQSQYHMFSPDVITLRQFYATPFGDGARALIADALRDFWPNAKGDTLLAIGFSTPYLGTYVRECASTIICMPAQQGAAYWPSAGDNCVLLAHESELPLPESSINRVLLLHSVENSEELEGMIKELYRVLTPGGRVLAIVPNRLGLWARSSRSPFGYGRPFSMAQLRELMSEHQLTVTRSSSALFVPPTQVWENALPISGRRSVNRGGKAVICLHQAAGDRSPALFCPQASRRAGAGDGIVSKEIKESLCSGHWL